MKNPLLQASCLSLIFLSVVGCNRVPVGIFGVSGAGGANAISVDAGSNIAEERKLTRLKQIDQKIQESADRLSAILDPSKTLEPANLAKLVIGDEIDPSLRNDRHLNANQIIEQKLDQKAQDLISGTVKASGTSPDNSAPDTSLLNDRTLRNQAEIDQNLNTRANVNTEPTTKTAQEPAVLETESKPTETESTSESEKTAPSL